jgi:uncharacterized protein (DUF2062 family)
MPNPLSRWVDRNLPTREDMARNRYLAPISHRFLSPGLWRFTRRSVPRGVALGLFAGFIVPIGQIFVAAFLAWPARANVPIAALMTFITNPFTLPFWLVAANKVGAFVLKIDAAAGDGIGKEIASGALGDVGWWVHTAGVTAFGFAVLAIVTAAGGYLMASWLWRWRTASKRNAQLRRRTAAPTSPA